ncbi:MAG: nucleotidyltransferase family protein [Cyanobacteria bacterium P01_B01_bin.77]
MAKTTIKDNDIQLLLYCLSPVKNSQTIQQIEILVQGEIDWTALIQLAKKHKVGPLFYNQLSNLAIEAVPTLLQNKFRQYSQTMAGRNLFITFELTRLLSLMTENGIDPLPYKGPVLAQTIYQTLNLRLFSDLDIVVQPQDIYAVEDLLIAEGYRPYYGKKSRTELAAHMKSAAEHTYDFYHDSKRIFIEVHWRFWPKTFSSVNPTHIWHRRQTATVAGKSVSTLAIEDYLIILCIHGSRHMWQRLSWLCDIAILLHNYPDLDWQRIVEQAHEWGVRRMLYLGLYLAQTWLNAPLPEAIVQRLSTEPTLPALAAQVEYQAFQAGKPPKTFLATTQYQLHVRERWQDKRAYTLSFIRWLLKGCPSTAD